MKCRGAAILKKQQLSTMVTLLHIGVWSGRLAHVFKADGEYTPSMHYMHKRLRNWLDQA